MKQFLIDVYSYPEEEITILIDQPGQQQPSLKNIRKESSNLVAGAAAGDHFFFYYTGHSIQVAELSGEQRTELDGKDEVLVPSDGHTGDPRGTCLVDNELKRLLVNPLPEESSLTAVFDTCHSATLLDLDHDECNAKWSCFRGHTNSTGPFRQMMSIHNKRQGRVSSQSRLGKDGSRSSLSRREEVIQQVETARPNHQACARNKYAGGKKMPGDIFRRCDSPAIEPRELSHAALVISISACRDDQSTPENINDKDGASFTQRLLSILTKNPHPPMDDLMASISVSMHAMLVNTVDKENVSKLSACVDPQMCSGKEMNMKSYLETL
ncbi:peptidase C14, caspase domain-containing protein [Mycena crocata]|nr:peptidase C14, caspase domain-containing protein [Mycena crocata]